MKRPFLIVDNDLPSSTAVCVVGLDNLTQITSAYGSHAAGAAISEFKDRLRQLIRADDAVAEIAPTKFCITLQGLSGDNHAYLAGAKIERLFADPMVHDDRKIDLVVHAGFACAADTIQNAETLFRAAETAREAAAADGVTFDVARSDRVAQLQHDWTVNEQIDAALKDHALELFYQPKISLDDGRPCGAEGLIRWHSPTGIRNPTDFVTLLDQERLGEMTRYCIRAAVRELVNNDRLPAIAVNVDTSVVHASWISAFVLDEVRLWSVDPSRLTIEVTETGIIGNFDAVQPQLEAMRDSGIRISLDNFGVGYSSLAQFKNLPIDEVKIDRSFVTQLQDPTNKYLTEMIIELGHFFNLQVVGEGVESAETLSVLKELHCDVVQGFWISAPLPL
ncbi:MAG: GGDEF domain-containing phosphodiesterase, partial [Gammaproteobacteria bacterium]|nr:GGDEF domain-containing phosphodiesterase [Gammaproteobacteria bacterium]